VGVGDECDPQGLLRLLTPQAPRLRWAT
jgi:hypothetical protein